MYEYTLGDREFFLSYCGVSVTTITDLAELHSAKCCTLHSQNMMPDLPCLSGKPMLTHL